MLINNHYLNNFFYIFTKISCNFFWFYWFYIGASAKSTSRSVEECGEVSGLVLTAGPALVGVMEVWSPRVVVAGFVMVVLHTELLPAPTVVTL